MSTEGANSTGEAWDVTAVVLGYPAHWPGLLAAEHFGDVELIKFVKVVLCIQYYLKMKKGMVSSVLSLMLSLMMKNTKCNSEKLVCYIT